MEPLKWILFIYIELRIHGHEVDDSAVENRRVKVRVYYGKYRGTEWSLIQALYNHTSDLIIGQDCFARFFAQAKKTVKN